ncbi:MAG: MarR family transcriptional regulator, partial [Candidatus Dormiibacterota bacterium]
MASEQRRSNAVSLSFPALLRAARTVYGEALRSALAAGGYDDVPRNGIYVIGAIAGADAPLSQIIEELGVSKQAAGQLVDALVERGYADREVDADDRRHLTISLTERGKQAAAIVRSAIGRLDAELLDRVGAEHVAHTRRTLAALVDPAATPLTAAADRGARNPEPTVMTAHVPAPGTPNGSRFAERVAARTGVEHLPAHLEARYGIRVAQLTELDLGVFRVDRHDGGPWVARILPATRAIACAVRDAEILRLLAEHDFPAERCAAEDAVSELAGQAVLVTDFVPDVPREQRSEAIRKLGGVRRLGELLGQLHTLSPATGAVAQPGGAWHHLADGGPREELTATAQFLADAAGTAPAGQRARYATLREEVLGFDGGDGLPQALAHPDFVMANVLASPDRGLVLVDWVGAGRAARIWALAFLLYSQGARDPRRVDAVVAGYRRRVR